eukprot:6202538-Pleurochrysis_carterae.AAC.2
MPRMAPQRHVHLTVDVLHEPLHAVEELGLRDHHLAREVEVDVVEDDRIGRGEKGQDGADEALFIRAELFPSHVPARFDLFGLPEAFELPFVEVPKVGMGDPEGELPVFRIEDGFGGLCLEQLREGHAHGSELRFSDASHSRRFRPFLFFFGGGGGGGEKTAGRGAGDEMYAYVDVCLSVRARMSLSMSVKAERERGGERVQTKRRAGGKKGAGSGAEAGKAGRG